MKAWPLRIMVSWLVLSSVWIGGRAVAEQTGDAALQAIQQAPDPSAAVAAYASGFALDQNNPKLHEAFVARMVDLGLPEMAYHQAQTLTALQANNGLAWGVVAYVDARRGQMPEAVSAVNLAGQFAPDSKFVQHTAGELIAWYDFKADKASIPDSAKDGLAKVRSLLDKRPAFTEAYATAQKAYQTQASASAQPPPAVPAQVAPNQVVPTVPNAPQAPMAPRAPLAPQAQADQIAPQAYAEPPPATAYYPDFYSSYDYPDYVGTSFGWGPDYCYDWGPGWVAPSPWCWWYPFGFWGGCDFVPFGGFYAFGGFDDFRHSDHNGDFGQRGHFGRDGAFARNGSFGHGSDPALGHNDPHGQNSFFGTPAQPSASAAQWARAGSQARSLSSGPAATSGSTRWWNSGGQHNSFATASASARSANSSPAALTPTGTRVGQYDARNYSTPLTAAPRVGSFGNYRATASPRSSYTVSSFRAPGYAGPRYAAPSGGSFRGYVARRGSAPVMSAPRFSSGASFAGGFRNSSSFGGGFRAGSSFRGGFHGGGFSGGGSHGGGHR
jgi:hypothetical protein